MKKITSTKRWIRPFCGIKPALVLSLLLFCSAGFAQGLFTWMHGNNAADQAGSYGTMGVSSALNYPGGKEHPVTWKDNNGNLWLFGGYGYDGTGNTGYCNDLWKYDVANNQWAWMNGDDDADPIGNYGTLGVAAAANQPGGREYSTAWTDASGNFWLFGGVGYDDGSSFGVAELNDLWKYDVSTNQWTWMSGSSVSAQIGTYGTLGTPAAANIPGSRLYSKGWADASGNLWLHAGLGYDGASNWGTLNDLWRYNIGTNQWTWMNGVNGVDQSGIYGTINVAAAANTPGSRYASQTWTDNSGNFYLFGGSGYDANSGFEDLLNDLWKYNVVTGQWTWLNGSNTAYQPGTYGTQGVAAAANTPGSRVYNMGWKNAQGDLLLFGGVGLDGLGNDDLLNDLWKYNVTTNEWAWVDGSDQVDEFGTYGVMGTPSTLNIPGARFISCGWTDNSGDLWLFGGLGLDDTGFGNFGLLNDLWKYHSCSITPTVSISSSTTSFCLGGSTTLTASGAATYLWSNNQTNSVTVITPANAGVTTISVTPTDANGCVGSNTTAVSFTAYAYPVANLSSTSPTFCLGGSSTITATGAANYSWSTTQTGSIVSVSPNTPGVTTLTVYPSSNGCSNSATISVTAFALPSLSTTSTKTEICKGEAVTLTASGANTYTWSGSPALTTAAITISPSATAIYTVSGKNTNGCMSTAIITQSVSECTGIAKNNIANVHYNLYPNPSNGSFTISGPHFGNNTQLIIYNLLGQKVSVMQVETEQTKIQVELPQGLYNYSVIENEQAISAGKLIIE